MTEDMCGEAIDRVWRLLCRDSLVHFPDDALPGHSETRFCDHAAVSSEKEHRTVLGADRGICRDIMYVSGDGKDQVVRDRNGALAILRFWDSLPYRSVPVEDDHISHGYQFLFQVNILDAQGKDFLAAQPAAVEDIYKCPVRIAEFSTEHGFLLDLIQCPLFCTRFRWECDVITDIITVRRILPSAARIFKRTQFVYVSLPSSLRRVLSIFQWFLGLVLSDSTWQTSITEKYHSSCCLCHTLRIWSLKKNSRSCSSKFSTFSTVT